MVGPEDPVLVATGAGQNEPGFAMSLQLVEPSEARRLTSVLRAGSSRSDKYDKRAQLEERAATLQLVLEGGVRQRFLADGRRHTVAAAMTSSISWATSARVTSMRTIASRLWARRSATFQTPL